VHAGVVIYEDFRFYYVTGLMESDVDSSEGSFLHLVSMVLYRVILSDVHVFLYGDEVEEHIHDLYNHL
jgi:hypothetical protein